MRLLPVILNARIRRFSHSGGEWVKIFLMQMTLGIANPPMPPSAPRAAAADSSFGGGRRGNRRKAHAVRNARA